MQAIITKYHGPTNAHGSRVSAKCDAGRIFVPWDDAMNADQNHNAAAEALARKLDWHGVLVAGSLPDHSRAHVFASRKPAPFGVSHADPYGGW